MQAATAIDHWKGEFGDQYTERQANNIAARVAVWRQLLPSGCWSIFEVGANVGANLDAIHRIDHRPRLMGCEPNQIARARNPWTIISSASDDLAPLPDGQIDLVFTCGVLIHVPPDKLEQSLREIHRVSRKWIICGEYFAPSEEEIQYRGQSGLMWRRDYGSLYMDLFPELKCIKTLFAWKRTTGLDNLTFWVFEKPDTNT